MGKMCLDYVINLNRLIEEGDDKAIKHYIIEEEIEPEAYYEFFRSHSVHHPEAVGLAAKCGKVEVLKALFETGFSLHGSDDMEAFKELDHPIYSACEGGSVEAVKMIVEEYNVDITKECNLSGRGLMCTAACNGHVEVLRYLLERGVSVNNRYGAYRESALYAAAGFDQDETCRFLLSKGADGNLGDCENDTPLILSVKNDCFKSAKALLDAGADVNFMNHWGETAFYLAAIEDKLDMMKLLHSRAVQEISSNVIESVLREAVRNDSSDVVKYLVNECNVPLHPPEYYENPGQVTVSSRPVDHAMTACRVALEAEQYHMVTILMDAGYNPSKDIADFEKRKENVGRDLDILFPFIRRERKYHLQRFKRIMARPRSLFNICKLTIRHVLGRRLPVDLPSLPLPDILKREIKDLRL